MAFTKGEVRRPDTTRRSLRNHSLSLVCFGLAAIFIVGLLLTGYRQHNADQKEHRQPELSLGEYATSGAFWEALTEKWESEYLQMAGYVVLTVFLVQKGSSESKRPGARSEDFDRDPRKADLRRTSRGRFGGAVCGYASTRTHCSSSS